MAKWDDAVAMIRSLLGGTPRGVPLEVSDDVARAATRGTTTSPDALYDAHGRSLPVGSNGWPVGTESWGTAVDDAVDQAGAARLFSPEARVNGTDGPAFDTWVRSRLGDAPAAEPDFELGSPLWHQLDKGSRAFDNIRRGRTGNLRNQDPQLVAIAGRDIRDRAAAASRPSTPLISPDVREMAGDAALAAGVVGAGFAIPGGKPASPPGDLTDTSGTEDLAEESRPAPSVKATPNEKPAYKMVPDITRRAKPASAPPEEAREEAPDYSFQARQLIAKLNDMRRKAGGEVPEAKAIMAEVQRLLDLSNRQRNSPDYKPSMPTDYHGEAQRLIQQLNEMRRKAGGEVPQAAKMMAEIRRLQALGDRMRNAG